MKGPATTGRVVRVADAMVVAPKTLPGEATAAELREFFGNSHVHMALIVDDLGRLSTTVVRGDLPCDLDGDTKAARLGTLDDRTVLASEPLEPVTARLRDQGLRRLAVTDDDRRLVGLLCFKRSGNGYCTDDGIRARAQDRKRRSRQTAL